MRPELVRVPEMHLAGYVCHTTSRFGEGFFAVPKFWQEYIREGRMDRLLNEPFARQRVQYGVSFPEDPMTGKFDYLVGVPVAEETQVPGTYEVRTLPAAFYVVFSSAPAVEENFSAAVYNTWAYIFGNWLPSSGMVLDGRGLQFERYDDRSLGRTGKVCDVYVPVICTPGMKGFSVTREKSAAPEASYASPKTAAVNV